jgi:hypothetical protein
MTVEELMEELSQMDKTAEVLIGDHEGAFHKIFGIDLDDSEKFVMIEPGDEVDVQEG